MKNISVLRATAGAFLAVALQAQVGHPPMPGHFGPGMLGHSMKVVTGAPYTAQESFQFTQTLQDGNTVQRSSPGTVARDSQGRVRVEQNFGPSEFAGNPEHSGPVIFISDPIAGYAYVLHPDKKIAVRRPFHAEDHQNSKTHRPEAEGTKRNDAERVEESLGTQTIQGVAAEGKRVTTTIAAGKIGNSAPIVTTNEVWYSQDLQTNVLMKRNDPRMGQSTFSLTNIQRTEPNAALFQVPSDYKIEDASERHSR